MILHPPAHFRLMLKRLRSTDGATLVEYALVLPLILIGVLGSWQLSYIGWAQNRLESAVREGSRIGITGQSTNTLNRQQLIEQTVTTAMANVSKDATSQISFSSRAYPTFSTLTKPGEPFDDTNNNNVCDVGETYYEFDGVPGRSMVDIGKFGTGGPGDIVRYSVTFPVKLFVPLASRFFGSNGKLDLNANTVVRNEMFGVGAAPTSGTC